MKEQEIKEKFIELRSKDYSFDRIAKEISVSKPTLIKWKEEFSREIQNIKFCRMEELLEKYQLMKQERVEVYAAALKDVLSEIRKRKYETLSTKELFNLALSLEKTMKNELMGFKYGTGEFIEKDALDVLWAGERTEKEIELVY